MANWRDTARLPAKFRGVEFWVTSSERSGGRDGPLHKYPFKDVPFKEDTGRAPQTFRVEGVILGEDYKAQRDALITELEDRSGPGELVHPYHGTRQVVAQSYTQRESTDLGGLATFSIEFVASTAKPAQPTSIPDAPALVRASSLRARVAVGLEFLAKFAPGTLLDSVTGQLGDVTAAMNATLSTVSMATQSLAALQRQVNDFADGAVALINAPEDLLADQILIFEALADGLIASVDAVDPIGTLLALYSFNPGVRPPGGTVNRLAEQVAFDQAQLLTQRLVVIEAARLAVELTFESYDQAVAARDTITALIDEQCETVEDDVYPALLQLRADLVNAVPGDSLELARLVAHTPRATLPSLVLAHELYGGLTREADLCARNAIRHPGFVTGGVELEILSDG